MWKHIISDFFSFTKKERTGILVLVVLIVFFMLLPFLFPYFIKQKSYDHVVFEKAIASLKIKQEDSSASYPKRDFGKPAYQNYYQPNNKAAFNPASKSELFYFDPNTASPADWKRLGVRDKTIATIQNYLSKGGKFYKKDDIAKIWGFHDDEVKRLIPYIQLHGANPTNLPAEKQYEKKEYKKFIHPVAIIDINTADTAAFIALPGIGSKLSQRIINFRDKLGGFYKVDQIGETFGLPDSTFQKIKSSLKISSAELRRININTATVDEMRLHPYLRYALANAIIQYRTQHGNYTEVTDIKKIVAVSEEIFNKVAPYLTVNQ